MDDELGSGPLVDRVKDIIEKRILSGELGPGAKLNANSIAEELGISRSPVREAMRALEQAGLAVSIPNRGVFVREVTLGEVLDLYEVHMALSRQAGQLLARRAKKDQIAALADLCARMDQACERLDEALFYEIDLVFHQRLMEFSGNPHLRAIDDGVKRLISLVERSLGRGERRLHLSSREHRAILEAITLGDEARAAAVCELHSIHGRERVLESLREMLAAEPIAQKGARRRRRGLR